VADAAVGAAAAAAVAVVVAVAAVAAVAVVAVAAVVVAGVVVVATDVATVAVMAMATVAMVSAAGTTKTTIASAAIECLPDRRNAQDRNSEEVCRLPGTPFLFASSIVELHPILHTHPQLSFACLGVFLPYRFPAISSNVATAA
jgi:hypothetical protein